MARWRACALAELVITCCVATVSSATALDSVSLEEGFQNPAPSASPRVWWHWINGNTTQEGIREDLEWMHRVGVGGVQGFDGALDAPQSVKQRLVFMTQPWKDAFHYATTLADKLGLELAIASSPGWSESGGPWVTPEHAMKKLVWSETRISGGVPFTGRLRRPPGTVGPFQDVSIDRSSVLAGPAPREPIPDLYHDVAVIAYRVPDTDVSMADLHPAITSSAGRLQATLLWDEQFSRAIHLPHGERGHPAWIQIDFGHPLTMKSMSLALLQKWNPLSTPHVGAELQASTDGVRFHKVTYAYDTTDMPKIGLPPSEETVTFPPVTARYFRLLMATPPAGERFRSLEMFVPAAPTDHQITEWQLHTASRVDHFEQKAGFFLSTGFNSHPTPSAAPADVVSRQDVIDLTAQLRSDGTLSWTPPGGHWAILRIGYSLLGITNHPASPEGTGLEVDKLSRTAVKAYMDDYLGRYESFLGLTLTGAHGLRAMVSDSWEAGSQNWTEELPREFARRRGYDLHLWLPALTGRIIGSAQATDQFLWDFRRTLGELLAENHYGQLAASLHARGMIHYGESHEVSRAFIGDGMDAKRDDDIPMGAMWMPGPSVDQTNNDADIRESASVAHIYGQNLVAAESMTTFGLPGTAFAFAPERLKPTADRELVDGVNLFVVHTSVHQPLDQPGPGITLGPFGQWFTRHETWAEEAGAWVTYLRRSCYLLQQGHFAADIVYYYGQDSNITALYGKQLPAIPEGYAFDFASTHALTKLSVEKGLLVTASGMRYRVLVLDPRTRLVSLDVLKEVARLVNDGATLVGDKPDATPSLADNAADFRALAETMWGRGTQGEHRYGKGVVLSGETVLRALEDLKVEPDFSYAKPHPDTTVWFVHRRLADGDLYFVNNRHDRAERIEAQFRVSGKAPELWHADSGAIEPASYRVEGDRTVVPLNLDPNDALFVVFRKNTQERRREIPEPVRQVIATIGGPWDVHFQSARSAPDQASFPELKSWTMSADAGIKYFSGTASYTKSFHAPASWLAEGRLEIDLGVVKDLAEVLVNGHSGGVLWKPPFRTDVTDLLRPGENRMEVRVTNLWVNRLIGDKQPHAKALAFTTFNPYGADSPLLESGLLGPVAVVRVTR